MVKRKPPRKRGPIHGRLVELRKAKDLSQGDLAAILGVHETAISHWENGILPDVERLPAIAKALDTTVADLIAGEKTFEAIARLFEAKAS